MGRAAVIRSAWPSMKRGVLLLVLLAALVFVAAAEDIESRDEHWKAEAIKLKAQEFTSKAALRDAESTINALKLELKAQLAESFDGTNAAANEAAQKQAEEEAAQKKQEEEAAQKKQEEEAAQKKAEEVAQITSSSSANATADSGPSVAQPWANYNIASDKPQPAQKRFSVKGIAGYWKASNELAFGWDTQLHFKNYTGFGGDKKFSSSAACEEFYKKKVERFGICGAEMGGWDKWKEAGCRALSRKPAPCSGSFSKGMRYQDRKKDPAGFKNSVGATARYKQRRSKLDNNMHSFYTVTNNGKAADSSDCEALAFVRIGTCKGCCCADGLIQYEIQSEDRSNTKNCRDWFMAAVAAASNFFGMWRLEESIKKVKACASELSTCSSSSKKKDLGDSRKGRKQASMWSKANAWQCLSSSPSRSGNCYSDKVDP